MRKFIVWIWLSRRARPQNRTGRCLEEVAEGEREIKMGRGTGQAFHGGPGSSPASAAGDAGSPPAPRRSHVPLGN